MFKTIMHIELTWWGSDAALVEGEDVRLLIDPPGALWSGGSSGLKCAFQPNEYKATCFPFSDGYLIADRSMSGSSDLKSSTVKKSSSVQTERNIYNTVPHERGKREENHVNNRLSCEMQANNFVSMHEYTIWNGAEKGKLKRAKS